MRRLFHRYHRQFFELEGSSGYPLWTTLRAVGMASDVERISVTRWPLPELQPVTKS